MYENKTWGEIFQMLRDKAEQLGRAPRLDEIPCASALVSGLKYGGWYYVLGHAGIYYRGSAEEGAKYPLFLEDFTEEQLISMVRRIARKVKHAPMEQDAWCYIECIYRWDTWENTLKVCGMNVPDSYLPQNPLPAPIEILHKQKFCRLR
ncbi:MAG: hypothetical protein IJO94_04880 [Firmicutes bacterium]|nr:hypothetical protein [Bacillota bacterium]MBQ4092252.1 hypothetical protein [Bacillota bacterium]MBQ6810721.1 hypothetical protein [Bacillota bacterium]